MTAGRSFQELLSTAPTEVQIHKVLAETVGTLSAEKDWIQLTPAPSLDTGIPIVNGRDGRKFTFADSLVDSFNRSGEHIAIDIEHEAQQGISNTVVGWIVQMAFRNDREIWGLAEWNDEGRKILNDRSFRSVSPAFRATSDSVEKFTSEQQDFLEIDVFESVAVTNFPNLKVRSLNSKRDTVKREKLIETLQLNTKATDEDIFSKIESLICSSQDIDKLVPRSDYDGVVVQLNSLQKELRDLRKDQHMSKVRDAITNAVKHGKISPASVDYHTQCCETIEGFERFSKFIESAPEIISNESQFEGKEEPILSLTTDQKEICSTFRISEEKFMDQQKRLKEEGKI